LAVVQPTIYMKWDRGFLVKVILPTVVRETLKLYSSDILKLNTIEAEYISTRLNKQYDFVIETKPYCLLFFCIVDLSISRNHENHVAGMY